MNLKEIKPEKFWKVTWKTFQILRYDTYTKDKEKVFLSKESAEEFINNLKICMNYIGQNIEYAAIGLKEN